MMRCIDAGRRPIRRRRSVDAVFMGCMEALLCGRKGKLILRTGQPLSRIGLLHEHVLSALAGLVEWALLHAYISRRVYENPI